MYPNPNPLSLISHFSNILSLRNQIDIGYLFYGIRDGGEPGSLSEIYNPIIQNVYVLGGLVTFAGIIYGGFMYIRGAGEGNGQQIEQGQRALTWSFIGLIILFSVYWIAEIIREITGIETTNLP